MSVILFPFVISDGEDMDAGPVMANLQAISAVVNGGLELGTNVAAGSPIVLTGAVLADGSSLNAARADHAHIVRGFEQLTADPTSNNFEGRMYTNTSTGLLRYCTNPAGSGTFITIGNMTATDLPLHAAQHITGDDILNVPACSLTRTGTGGISAATLTAVAFGSGAGTELYDTDSMHDMTVNPNRITFTHGGLYHSSANLAFDVNATSTRWAYIQRNGTGQVLAGCTIPGTVTDNPILSLSCDYVMSPGDYVELYVYQNSGGTLNLLGSSSAMTIGSRTAPMNFSARWTGQG